MLAALLVTFFCLWLSSSSSSSSSLAAPTGNSTDAASSSSSSLAAPTGKSTDAVGTKKLYLCFTQEDAKEEHGPFEVAHRTDCMKALRLINRDKIYAPMIFTRKGPAFTVSWPGEEGTKGPGFKVPWAWEEGTCFVYIDIDDDGKEAETSLSTVMGAALDIVEHCASEQPYLTGLGGRAHIASANGSGGRLNVVVLGKNQANAEPPPFEAVDLRYNIGQFSQYVGTS